MGLDDFDRALLNAWERACREYRDDPQELPQKLAKLLKTREMSTYARALRSWSLVLRACDSRIEDNNTTGMVRMDGARIRSLCSPVKIDYPGVSLDEAARLFGVNRTTVARWASPKVGVEGEVSHGVAVRQAHDKAAGLRGEKVERKKRKRLTWYQEVRRQMDEMSDMKWAPRTYRVEGERLMLEHFHNEANVKRSETRVWTPGGYGLDPGGEVWSADWGACRRWIADEVDPGFVQDLQRVDRKLGGDGIAGRFASPATRIRSRVWQWVCPEADGGCGRLVYKLYMPMRYWTLGEALGGIGVCSAQEPGAEAPSADFECSGGGGSSGGREFLCLRCAGLIYESAERGSSPGRRVDGSRRRVDVKDRLVKRMSGGVLRGGDVFTDS